MPGVWPKCNGPRLAETGRCLRLGLLGGFQGDLGLKSGRGFLDIDQQDKTALLAYRDAAYGRLSQLRAELGEAPGL